MELGHIQSMQNITHLASDITEHFSFMKSAEQNRAQLTPFKHSIRVANKIDLVHLEKTDWERVPKKRACWEM
jgi:hypothetical protein